MGRKELKEFVLNKRRELFQNTGITPEWMIVDIDTLREIQADSRNYDYIPARMSREHDYDTYCGLKIAVFESFSKIKTLEIR